MFTKVEVVNAGKDRPKSQSERIERQKFVRNPINQSGRMRKTSINHS